jgi:hypothetical protein
MVLCCQVLDLMLLCGQSLDVALQFMQTWVHSEFLNKLNHLDVTPTAHQDDTFSSIKRNNSSVTTRVGVTICNKHFKRKQNNFIPLRSKLRYDCLQAMLMHTKIISKLYVQYNSLLTWNMYNAKFCRSPTAHKMPLPCYIQLIYSTEEPLL